MEIYHPEEEIREKLPDGRTLVTYTNDYVEKIEDMSCPFCKHKLRFHLGKHEVARGIMVDSYEISCIHGCHFSFYGIQEEYEFKDCVDFVNFVRDKLKSI